VTIINTFQFEGGDVETLSVVVLSPLFLGESANAGITIPMTMNVIKKDKIFVFMIL
jgi:hypothetical protein